jgi:hypothetical protein
MITDKFETQVNIDRDKYPDDMMVKICGKDMKLGDARIFYDNFLEHRYKMVLFWDDIVQYTSMGLLDLIYQYNKIDKKVIANEFFNRDFPTYDIDFVYDKCKAEGLDKFYVDSFFESHYEEILRCSPLSNNAVGFFKMREILDSMIIVFAYDFESRIEIVKELEKSYPTLHFSSIISEFRNNKTEEEMLKNIYKTKKSYIDVVAMQQGGALIELIAQEKLKEVTIMCPQYHNGIAPGALIYFTNGNECMGPNESPLILMNEEI